MGAPFACSVDRIGFVDFSLFCYWFLWSTRSWDIILFLVGLVIQSILPPTKHIQQHHDLEPKGPSLQQVGCVWFILTRGPKLNLLYFDQPSKNVKDQSKCEMHLLLVVWNLSSMHRTLQSLTILNPNQLSLCRQ
jgi:hypothetical protein